MPTIISISHQIFFFPISSISPILLRSSLTIYHFSLLHCSIFFKLHHLPTIASISHQTFSFPISIFSNTPPSEQLQQLLKLISILSLYLHYLATLYLFFQTNSPAVLSIHSLFYLNILFYSFFILLSYLNVIFFIHSCYPNINLRGGVI